VDVDTKELSFFKTKIERINGLEKLKNLDTITFNRTAFIVSEGFNTPPFRA